MMSPDSYVDLAIRLIVEFLVLLFELLVWLNETLPSEVRDMILFFLFCLLIIRSFLAVMPV